MAWPKLKQKATSHSLTFLICVVFDVCVALLCILHIIINCITRCTIHCSMAATKHCEELLPGLDEDIAEYISGILEDDDALEPDSVEDTTAMIAGLLDEYCEENGEDPSEKAAALIARLTTGGGQADSAAVKPSTDLPVKFGGISLADQLKTNDYDLVYGDNNKRNTVNSIIEENPDATTTTKSKTKTKSNKPTASQIANSQIAEIEAELHDARVAAVKARAKYGAYRGSLDAKAFTLPNPGGGAPLLEDAACRLVWGKRYGKSCFLL